MDTKRTPEKLPGCNCYEVLRERYRDLCSKHYPGYEPNNFPEQIDLLSLRQYATWIFNPTEETDAIVTPGTKVKTKKKKPMKSLLLFSYCPHCGQPYIDKEDIKNNGQSQN